MRVLLFGMRCHFTPPVLTALIGSRHEVVGVVLPGRQPGRGWRWLRAPGSARGLPLGGVPTVDSLANNYGVPLAELNPGGIRSARETLGALRPDIVVVACFPRLISTAILDLAPLGGVNLHPSMLPKLRGPEPLFWTLHQGLSESGVTLHRLTDRFDAGEILAHRPVEIPAGVRIDRLETVMGQVGGGVLLDSLAQWSDINASARPQDDAEATYAPNPGVTDFRVPVDWPVERAIRFIRGVASIGQAIEIFDDIGLIWRVRDAEHRLSDDGSPTPIHAELSPIDVAFSDGILRITSGEKVR